MEGEGGHILRCPPPVFLERRGGGGGGNHKILMSTPKIELGGGRVGCKIAILLDFELKRWKNYPLAPPALAN